MELSKRGSAGRAPRHRTRMRCANNGSSAPPLPRTGGADRPPARSSGRSTAARQQLEIVSADQLDASVQRLTAGTDLAWLGPGRAVNAFEYFPGPRRELLQAVIRPHAMEPDQPLRLPYRQLAPEHAIDQAVDRRVGANPKAQRKHRHRGASALPGEHPDRISHIAPEIIEPSPSPHRTRLLGRISQISQFGTVRDLPQAAQLFLHLALCAP